MVAALASITAITTNIIAITAILTITSRVSGFWLRAWACAAWGFARFRISGRKSASRKRALDMNIATLTPDTTFIEKQIINP